MKISFFSANGPDPDEMPHCVAFHLGLNCLPKYLSTYLGISGLQRVPLVLFELSLFSEYSGPPDPLHGNTPYVMVRKNAQVLLLFSLF